MRKALVAISAALMVALTAAAALAEYSPTLEFKLSDTKVLANPSISIKVAQDADEEELGHVTLTIPKGFNLPTDEAIATGTVLGTADLTIAAGPACRNDAAGQIPLAPSATIPDRQILELDRTDEQADRGVIAVWVVDLKPVTTIPLELTGSIKKGWKLDGDIPANDQTCPPLVFDGTIAAKAGEVSILTNPKKPGTYVFGGFLSSTESPTITEFKTPITITK
ncbi:MAG: hypothetical protein QOG54_2299 [Actinomycetota bacterium]|jgi:hypothetical protein|nr:hypothetical protein [Actinomycetota bacterium]